MKGGLTGSEAFAPASGRRPSRQAWMVSFTDLIALMLAFFVMLFAMSKVEQRKWQNLTDALSENLNAVREVPAALPTEQLGIDHVRQLAGTDLDYLAVLISQNMAADPLLGSGVLTHLGDRIVIALPGDLLFAPGSSKLAASGQDAMVALGGLLRHLDNRIEVTGYADPRKPASGFVSNWDLSLARALRVAALLERFGDRGEIVARGFGDARFGALSPRLEPARRLQLGRRVEVVVHVDGGELR